MNANEIVTLSRKELYELVWSTPMSKLCREYGISDVALAKTCKRHEIPYPPRGYWAKVRNGQRVHKPALRAASDSRLESIRIQKRLSPFVDDDSQREAAERATAELGNDEPIHVPEQLTEPHPLIERTVRSMSSAKPNEHGLVRPKASRCLDIEVSPPSVDRAARILDALIKALEKRGYSVSPGDGAPQTWVTVLEETVSLRLEEMVQREEKVQSFFHHVHEYEYQPTGKLVLIIGGTSGQGYRRKWSDSKKPLEGRLKSVIAALIAAAQSVKAAREQHERWQKQREEEERARQEKERIRREEAARVKDFEQKLIAWEQAERIRAFVNAVRNKAIHSGVAIIPGGELDNWLTWALRRAERIDPIANDRGENRWPPPTGHKVNLSDQHSYGGYYDYGGTAIVPPVCKPPEAPSPTESKPSGPADSKLPQTT